MRVFSALVCLILIAGAANADPQRYQPQNRQQILYSFAPLVKRTAPAVVNVYAKTVQRQQQLSPFDDPFFRQFFGDLQLGPPRERVANSLGSGVIVDAGGIIVTNYHVIKGATNIRVALTDKREFEAKLILSEEKTDLAVLQIKVNDETLPALTLGDSDNMEVGDLVLAIGNPFGVGQTVTNGIVSALSRTDVGASNYQSFIQTDAPINPGNSGGALINMKGELIGINSMIYSRSGGSVGLGFAIPSNLVATVVESAQQGDMRVIRPWFGGDFQNVTQDLADSLDLARPEGVLIVRLNPLSPLAKAGLKSGDVILTMDGKHIENAQELNYLLGISRVGDVKLMEYKRETDTFQVPITLVAAPETVDRQDTKITGQSPFNGLTVANLSPAVADDLSLDQSAKGVAITEMPQGPAQQFFAKGDIIRQINGVGVESVDSLNRILAQQTRGWSIMLERRGQRVFLRLG